MAKHDIHIQRFSGKGEPVAAYNGRADPEGLLAGTELIPPDRVLIRQEESSNGVPYAVIIIFGDSLQGETRIQVDNYRLDWDNLQEA